MESQLCPLMFMCLMMVDTLGSWPSLAPITMKSLTLGPCCWPWNTPTHRSTRLSEDYWSYWILWTFFCLDYLVLPTGLINVFSICRFSTNEGQCWNIYNFTNDPLYFGAIVSEPGFRSMNVSLWGYRNRKKIVITIDFRMLLTRDCETFVTRDWCFEYWVLSTEL